MLLQHQPIIDIEFFFPSSQSTWMCLAPSGASGHQKFSVSVSTEETKPHLALCGRAGTSPGWVLRPACFRTERSSDLPACDTEQRVPG